MLLLRYKVKCFNFAWYEIVRPCQKTVSLLAWWCLVRVIEVCIGVRVAIRVIWDVKIVSTTKRGAITILSVDAVGLARFMSQFYWFNVDLVCQGEQKVFLVIYISSWTTYMTKNKAKQNTMILLDWPCGVLSQRPPTIMKIESWNCCLQEY